MANYSNDAACIIGVGASPQGKLPGYSGDDLAIIAVREALTDAGLERTAVDALLVQRSYAGNGDLREIGHRLGLAPALSWSVACLGEALEAAWMAIAGGLIDSALLVYGTNQRTNRNEFAQSAYHVGGNFDQVYGLANPGSVAAFNFRRRMHDYGATEEQLAAITVAQSRAAALNPLAVYRKPVSREEYLRSEYVIAPLRISDFSMISDGAFALVLGSAALARSSAQAPVYINAISYQSNFRELAEPDAMYHPSQRPNAARLWERSDFAPGDVDALYVQDAYTPNVLAALENYGFCELGTAHEWIQGGRIELDGELPVNVNGGQNRMTYMVGWQNAFDAVKQVRHQADMPGRQLSKCDNVLLTMSTGLWQQTCSMVLHG